MTRIDPRGLGTIVVAVCALALAGCGGKPKTAAAPPPSQTITVAVAGIETLPREIAVRQQQYAYYRDRLLSFPKPEEMAV